MKKSALRPFSATLYRPDTANGNANNTSDGQLQQEQQHQSSNSYEHFITSLQTSPIERKRKALQKKLRTTTTTTQHHQHNITTTTSGGSAIAESSFLSSLAASDDVGPSAAGTSMNRTTVATKHHTAPHRKQHHYQQHHRNTSTMHTPQNSPSKAQATSSAKKRRPFSALHHRSQTSLLQQDATRQLIRQIFDMCEDLHLSTAYTDALQRNILHHQSSSASGNPNHDGSLTRLYESLKRHRYNTLNVLRRIEARERVLQCMQLFNEGVHGSPKPLSQPQQTEGEAILVSLRDCSAQVEAALDVWEASATAIDWAASNKTPSSDLSQFLHKATAEPKKHTSEGEEEEESVEAVEVEGRRGRSAEKQGDVEQTQQEEHKTALASASAVFRWRGTDYRRKMLVDRGFYETSKTIWTELPEELQELQRLHDQEEEARQVTIELNECRVASALRIQKLFRGHRVRLYTEYLMRKTRAAIKIQTRVRIRIAKKKFALLKRRNELATKIQSLWRGHCMRQRFAVLLAQDAAARQVQHFYKARLSRFGFQTALARLRRENEASYTIVSVFRRHTRNQKNVRQRAALRIQKWYEARVRAWSVSASSFLSTKQPTQDEAGDDGKEEVDADTTIAAPTSQTCHGGGVVEVSGEVLWDAAVDVAAPSNDGSSNRQQEGRNRSSSSSRQQQRCTGVVLRYPDESVVVPQELLEAEQGAAEEAEKEGEEEEKVNDADVGNEEKQKQKKQDEEEEKEREEENSGVPRPTEGPKLVYPGFCRRSYVRELVGGGGVPQSAQSLGKLCFDERDLPPRYHKYHQQQSATTASSAPSSSSSSSCFFRPFWAGDYDAAVLIQSAWRAHAARCLLRRMRAQQEQRAALATRNAVRIGLAIILQCHVRSVASQRLVVARVPYFVRSTIAIQRWWRTCALPSLGKRRAAQHHRDDALLGAPLDNWCAHKLEKLAVARILRWYRTVQRRVDEKQRRQIAAQITIAKHWRCYVVRRGYLTNVVERKLRERHFYEVEAVAQRQELLSAAESAMSFEFEYAALRLHFHELVLHIRSRSGCFADQGNEQDGLEEEADQSPFAETIQRFWRASYAKLVSQRMLRGKRIAKVDRSDEERRLWAATVIQGLFRGFQVRNCIRSARRAALEHAAAVAIQSRARVWLAKRLTRRIRVQRTSMYRELVRVRDKLQQQQELQH